MAVHNERLLLRLSDADRALLNSAAQTSGMTVSAFLRSSALREARVVLAEQAQLEQRPAVRIA